MEFSLPHILILLLIIVILFGGKKIPEVMRGLGSGIREFREGMKGNDQPPTNPPASTPTPTATNAPPQTPEQKS
jgi:sec-independent protein translocase protein TatA